MQSHLHLEKIKRVLLKFYSTAYSICLPNTENIWKMNLEVKAQGGRNVTLTSCVILQAYLLLKEGER